ncbi:MAG: hypothetical protein GF355_11155, partial [Candidatus Eisenbacteria bacterium]|nr:hypothetical protein [Candidatus Eisenbacteria bacterium]
DQLLIMAPAFWGDWEEEADTRRKGRLHFEVGSAADTTLELDEDPVLDMAAKVDRNALTRAGRLFVAALSDLARDLELPRIDAQESLDGVTGSIAASYETPWGLLVIGGRDGNRYTSQALQRIGFIIEPGGDDVYRGRAASAVGGLLRPFSAVIDLDGNDLYDAGERSFALGGAVLGVAVLADAAGDDTYRGGDGVQGAGFFGVGFLYDGAGVDMHTGRNLCQGAGAFGLGALVADCRTPPPAGPEVEEDRAYEAGLRKVPGTGAAPIRFDENDTYICARQSQGFASTFGAGLLYDARGNDVYRAGGRYLHRPLLPHDFQSLSQGYSIGFRPRAGGGVGVLIDEEGNDFYNGEVYAQAVGYWYAIGFLFDGAGNDVYNATQYAQGAGVHLAIGTLWDRGGDDHYVSKFGVTQGTAHDLSSGWLIDEGGNDSYLVSDGQAVSIANSASVFIDAQGDDVYATPRGGQARVHWARGFCGTGLFADLEGRDSYTSRSPATDGAAWVQNFYGAGVDLDRDIDLPGEVIPEITLTKEDSLRDVAELFETASLWEVGSARETVRRARKALIAKGMTAVDYAVEEKLGTAQGLEYRAIKELAEAYPDSFAARVLPRLEDDNDRVQRNAISLLGDLKREEAREPLESLLGRPSEEEHWTRAIHALGRIGDPEAAPAIRPFLNSDKERRRVYTAAALSALSDTAAVPLLVAALSDPVFTVRAAASSALRSLGTAAVDPLAASLDAGAGQSVLRLRTLGKIAHALCDSTDKTSLLARSRARDLLLDLLQQPRRSTEPAERAAAAEGLLQLGDPETRAAVALRMADEFHPLVLRAYERAAENEE